MKDLITITQEEYNALQFGRKALKCRLDLPRKWYEDKLNFYLTQENKTRTTYNLISMYKARLRYYDLHIDEANQMTEFQKNKVELAYWKKCFKAEGNKKMWKECIRVEKVAKESSIEDAQQIIIHALEIIHKHFKKEA